MAAAVLQAPLYRLFSMNITEADVIEQLTRQNEAAFEQVFKTHYKNLHAYAFSILKDEMAAEEMVQNVFYKLWTRTESLSISGSLAAYLYRAVNNESLNYLKHQKVKAVHGLHIAYHMNGQTDSASKRLHLKELEARLHIALNELPEQCRTIFQLSRFEELRYREIADRLNLSIKTVENQMGKALKILRAKLVDFLPVTLLFIINYLKNNN